MSSHNEAVVLRELYRANPSPGAKASPEAPTLLAADASDVFRQRLREPSRQIYDLQLQALRRDDRLKVVDARGKPADPLSRERGLRAAATASFGHPELLERALSCAAMTVPERARDDEGGQLELVDTALARPFALVRVVSYHLASAWLFHPPHQARTYPFDFPFGPELERALYRNDSLRGLLRRHFGEVPGGHHLWPALQVLFRGHPTALARSAEEILSLLSRYFGFDPLKGALSGRAERESPQEAELRVLSRRNPFER